MCFLKPARADFPSELAPSEVDAAARKYDCDKISLDVPAAALLLLPRGSRENTDGKYHQPYHAACHVYVPDPDSHSSGAAPYTQRFLVYGAGQASKPEMIRVARLLLILWDEEHIRLHHDHDPDVPTVQVWLSEQRGAGLSPDTGGEQFKNQIYIYDVLRERLPMERAREVAHEYGHYALPGISGFHSPEEWANGILGERLYMKWISEDIHAARLKDTGMPYVAPSELDYYISKQVAPLIRRVDSQGISGIDLTRRDAEGMDNYIALALFIDQFYGSAQLLSAMSYTAPAHQDVLAEAPDFLKGFIESVQSTPNLKVTINVGAGSQRSVQTVYLTAGTYTAEAGGAISSWKMFAGDKSAPRQSAQSVRAAHNGWFTITVDLADRTATGSLAQLLLTRRNGN